MQNPRLMSNIAPKLQDDHSNLLSIYEHLPVVTLEKAVERISHLVPDVVKYVSTAKRECRRGFASLTCDESAAIYLYTMPNPFPSGLNAALRDPILHTQHPWLLFLKLLTNALDKLPYTKATIWRGIKYDATLDFVENNIYTWWGVTSCSRNHNVVEPFLGESGILFVIETAHGKDISMFSAVPEEQEVILMPGTRMRVRHSSLNLINQFFIIYLEDLDSQK